MNASQLLYSWKSICKLYWLALLIAFWVTTFASEFDNNNVKTFCKVLSIIAVYSLCKVSLPTLLMLLLVIWVFEKLCVLTLWIWGRPNACSYCLTNERNLSSCKFFQHYVILFTQNLITRILSASFLSTLASFVLLKCFWSISYCYRYWCCVAYITY